MGGGGVGVVVVMESFHVHVVPKRPCHRPHPPIATVGDDAGAGVGDDVVGACVGDAAVGVFVSTMSASGSQAVGASESVDSS